MLKIPTPTTPAAVKAPQERFDMTQLWVDKHRPKTLDEIEVDQATTRKLKLLSTCQDLPHLCFYGPQGAGKRTKVHCLLREIFGDKVYEMSVQSWNKTVIRTEEAVLNHKAPTKTKTEITIPILYSNHHVEVTPSEVPKDWMVVQHLIREVAGSRSDQMPSSKNFTAIVIHEADTLSREAQASLRRTMEKYSSQCKLIFVCENISRLMPAIQSRCLLLRCRAPKQDEAERIFLKVAKAENVPLQDPSIKKLAGDLGVNLRSMLINLQMTICRRATKELHHLSFADWKEKVQENVNRLVNVQNQSVLKAMRAYDFMVSSIPPGHVIKEMLVRLLPHLSTPLKTQLITMACYYKSLIRDNAKEVAAYEAFLAAAMVCISEQKHSKQGPIHLPQTKPTV